MIVKLQTAHYLKFLSLKGGYTGSSQSTYVEMPHCWKSHAPAHLVEDSLSEVSVSDVLSSETSDFSPYNLFFHFLAYVPYALWQDTAHCAFCVLVEGNRSTQWHLDNLS